MISIVVAMADGNVIGKDNDFAWYLSSDLKRFKQLTTGNTVIMGRKTFDPHLLNRLGGPLPNRESIVITRNKAYSYPGVTIAHSLDEAIKLATYKDIFIIGGAQIFAQGLSKCDRLYVTRVHAKIDGDAFFADIPRDQFTITKNEDFKKDDKNEYDYSFIEYERKP